MTFEQTIRQNFVKFLVQQKIFCPITGDVLDVRTCVVILDADGDPAGVISPAAYRRIAEMAEDRGLEPSFALAEGNTFDENTLPKS